MDQIRSRIDLNIHITRCAIRERAAWQNPPPLPSHWGGGGVGSVLSLQNEWQISIL